VGKEGRLQGKTSKRMANIERRVGLIQGGNCRPSNKKECQKRSKKANPPFSPDKKDWLLIGSAAGFPSRESMAKKGKAR